MSQDEPGSETDVPADALDEETIEGSGEHLGGGTDVSADEDVDDGAVGDQTQSGGMSPAPPPPPMPSDQEAPADGDGEGKKTSRSWLRWSLIGVAVVLGALYVGGYFLTGARMPVNTTVGGVEVGSMSPADAEKAITQELGPKAENDIVLVHEDQQFTYSPADIGVSLDVEGSVENAGGKRSWNPKNMFRLFVGSDDLRPVLDFDDELFGAAVAGVGETVNIEVIEALITFPELVPVPREPVEGRIVTHVDLAAAVSESFPMSDEPITVPTAVVEPAVDSAGLERAMTQIAAPAVSAPVLLQVGEQQVELPVSGYATALEVRVEGGQMVPYLDPAALAGPLTDSTTGIGEKAVDASIDIVDGAPTITPGKAGVGLQPEEMATKLLPVLTEEGEDRTLAIEATAVEPAFTTADAEAMNIVEKVGEFSTQYPHAPYRNTNQGRAAELIDGVLVKPGETFSFNDTVGERTVANGFTSGTVINGGVFREEMGGGVSQVVTTVYNAAFFSGLEDVEHHPHAFYISRYPMGREATVYFGSLDLRFKNSTPHGVLIKAWINPSAPGSNGEMHVEMWSTKIYDIEAGLSAQRNFRSPGVRHDPTAACVPQSPVQGFDVDVYRIFKQNGQTVKTETNTAVYQAADRVICGPPPEAPPPAD